MNSAASTGLGLLRSPALADLDRRGVVTVAGASLVINLLLFALPLYTLQVYDRVFMSRSVETLVMLTLIVGFALSAAAALEAVRSRLLLRIGNAFALKLGSRLFDCAIAESARTSSPSGQALRDLNVIRGFLGGHQGMAALFDVPLVILFLVAVYMLHVSLGHVMLFGVVVLMGLTWLTEWLTGPPLRAANEAAIAAQTKIDGVLQNAEVAEAMGMRAALRGDWGRFQGHAMLEASIAGDRSTGASSLAKWIRYLLNLLMTLTGAWLVIHDQITVGGMIASSILSARGLAPLDTMIGAWKGLVRTRISVARINEVLATHLRMDGQTQLPMPKGNLAVEQLAYAPPGAELMTLKGVSFQVPAGCWLGLIGPSGAGKSTLARLICGVWQARSGCVRLDGADVYRWNREDFGQHCGYLPQDVELFAGTVRDNIARFRPESSDGLVVKAARIAGAHEMILRLPKGYDTLLGPAGASLSAGQRQRIGLARALYGQPRLVVLDEPNSNLDNEGELALVEAIGQAREEGATVVMISHRPSLLAGADLLGVLLDGRLQEFGPREEVLRKLQPKLASRSAEDTSRHVA